MSKLTGNRIRPLDNIRELSRRGLIGLGLLGVSAMALTSEVPGVTGKADAKGTSCIERTFHEGDRNKCIRYAQIILNNFESPPIVHAAENGYYGPKTEAEVEAFQQWNNEEDNGVSVFNVTLPVDGILSASDGTWGEIGIAGRVVLGNPAGSNPSQVAAIINRLGLADTQPIGS
jgi:peptidoglycan hydrolase-like protein with peptidoglycan-binding domain